MNDVDHFHPDDPRLVPGDGIHRMINARGAEIHSFYHDRPEDPNNDLSPYEQLHRRVQRDGAITEPAEAVRLPSGEVQIHDGHHRWGVAHSLQLPLPVRFHEPHQGCRNCVVNKLAATRQHKRALEQGWLPTQRLFGPTYGFDHRLFDGDRLKPEVRAYILRSIDEFWRPRYGRTWPEWARVYFAGSEASEWTSETLEGNNDFDVLIGIDYDRFRALVPGHENEDNEEITERFNHEFKSDGLNGEVYLTIDGVSTGPWDRTSYVNPNSYDIREIRPYAAYDVTADAWAVRPPELPEWDITKFPEGPGLVQEISGIIEMAQGVLAMPEPYRTQNGAALWQYVHDTRSQAFGPQGEGWWDARNAVEKALDQAGLMHPLWECMDRARHDPHALDAPSDWSNAPRS